MGELTGIEMLRNELRHFQADVANLSHEQSPGARLRPEDLWRRVRATSAVVRNEILPHLEAEEEIVVPALEAVEAVSLSIRYQRLVREEIGVYVARLAEVEDELRIRGPRPALVVEATRVLAAITALATLALRYSGEVAIPALAEVLGDYESEMLAESIAAYERAAGAHPAPQAG